MADITLITAGQLTDQILRQLNEQNEQNIPESEVLEGTKVDEFPRPSSSGSPSTSNSPEKELRARVESGEWDNMDDLPAFKARTPEGQLMARTEAIDCRVRQLETRLPMLLNQHLHDAYIQVLKKISALKKTKTALFYYFYKNSGQRDLPSS
jgi:hypothetical protein